MQCNSIITSHHIASHNNISSPYLSSCIKMTYCWPLFSIHASINSITITQSISPTSNISPAQLTKRIGGLSCATVKTYLQRDNKSELQSSASARALPAGWVCWNRGNILDTADFKASTSKGSEGRLSTRSGCLCSVSSSCSHFNMYCCYTKFFGFGGSIHSGKHCCVRRRLVTISLHFHATSNTA